MKLFRRNYSREIIQVKCFDSSREEHCHLLNQFVQTCTLDVLGEKRDLKCFNENTCTFDVLGEQKT